MVMNPALRKLVRVVATERASRNVDEIDQTTGIIFDCPDEEIGGFYRRMFLASDIRDIFQGAVTGPAVPGDDVVERILTTVERYLGGSLAELLDP